MGEWEAPAKVNISLLVGAPDSSGMHPIRSLVQTIEWCDLLAVEEGDDDRLEVDGADLPDGRDNLVWKAVNALEARFEGRRPALDLRLTKRIPVAAGLGGGSADAAAALAAVGGLLRSSGETLRAAAETVGADVPFALRGGTAWMEGYGERLSSLPPLEGFALGVVVAPVELSTPLVYRTWDELGGPVGVELDPRGIPPVLRDMGPLRNDLTAAARSLHEELADWATELAEAWGRPVAMSGSGPAHVAFFADLDEAAAAVGETPVPHRGAASALPRRTGPAPVDR